METLKNRFVVMLGVFMGLAWCSLAAAQSLSQVSPASATTSAAKPIDTENNTMISDLQKAIEIGSRLELMVDDFLIERMDGIRLQLQTPQEVPIADTPLNEKSIKASHYATIIKDGDKYRAYYRMYYPGYKGPDNDGNTGEITCYAESLDGIKWQKPNLGLVKINGSRSNNVILHESPFCHNFSPMLDTRPGVPAGERYKALAGSCQTIYDELRRQHPGDTRYLACAGVEPAGLHAFKSKDGIHWTKMQSAPVITSKEHAFDSQNVAFWSEAENCYVCYFRTFTSVRTISRTTSPDFLHWSEPVATNANLPGEELYTSQTHPYYRAPHIYIALPTRFLAGATTDIMFMTSRAGTTSFSRLFKEAFIRPGLDPERWGNRSNYVALNVVPLSPSEMCIYHCLSGHRYILRTDGFVSARAGFTRGELLTKPLSFSGKELILNYSTSAAGSLRIEIQDASGVPFAGFRLDDCPAIIGDEIERRVEWKQKPDLGALQGKPVRLRFVMTECDLYSFRFR